MKLEQIFVSREVHVPQLTNSGVTTFCFIRLIPADTAGLNVVKSLSKRLCLKLLFKQEERSKDEETSEVVNRRF